MDCFADRSALARRGAAVLTFAVIAAFAAPAGANDEGVLLAKVDASGQQVCKIDYRDPTDPAKTGIYTGQCEAGQPEGAGAVLYRNGDRFEGLFKAGLPHGSGSWYGTAGDSYRGEWRDGKRSGTGTYRWASGSEYVGEWAQDKRHGQGTFSWSNGTRFEGEFVANRHWNGTYYTKGVMHRCRGGNCR